MKREIQFRTSLNPRLFNGEKLRPEVRLALLRVAADFLKSLVMIRLKSLVMTGSNAGFNYTHDSDIDLHFIAATVGGCMDELSDMFQAKKSLWNAENTVTIKGHRVEVYVEDATNRAVSSGIYDIIHDRFISFPQRPKPVSLSDLSDDVLSMAEKIDRVMLDDDMGALKALIDELKSVRRRSLSRDGEYSHGNLVYKTLRGLGYIDLIYDKIQSLKNEKLTLESK